MILGVCHDICLFVVGDLKSTHVFESSAKTDTFPTPTEFDPTAVAALAPVSAPQSSQPTSTMNGSTQQSVTTTRYGCMLSIGYIECVDRSKGPV